MSETWMPSDEAIIDAWLAAEGDSHDGGSCCEDPEPIRALESEVKGE